MTDGLLEELRWRGLLQDVTPGLEDRLKQGPITAYVGFDPTAPSLQLGNLVPVMLLAHLQRAGGKPIVVLGGGTGMIGDPSGRRTERPLLSVEAVSAHVAKQRAQFERFFAFGAAGTGAEMVDNAEWLSRLSLIEFLRDTGKHFTLSFMLQKESVKGRMEEGISYTEFSYMLLQAYDFLHLFRTRRCELQMGGTDQWGNVTAGIELIRRVAGATAHGLSAPLITTASGNKFGKSEGNAVWLDGGMTPPRSFYDFWINADDRDVERYLAMFTFKTRDDIAALMAEHQQDPGRRAPHRALAYDLTARVHGQSTAEALVSQSTRRFGDLDPQSATEAELRALAATLPPRELPDGVTPETPAVDVIVASGHVKSKGEARRLIEQGGITINGRRVGEAAAPVGPPLPGRMYWVSRGKKNDAILVPRLP